MNDRFKFRAYDAHNKVMKFYSLKELAGEDKFGYDTEFEAIQSGFDNWKWMQSTNLKDKNSKEIYEGDIVIFHYLDAKKEENQVTESVPVPIKSIWWFAQAIKAYQITGIEFEIIGNIYQNPELLS